MNCPLCTTDSQDILWQNTFCRIILVNDPAYPAFCRVILNAHVKEMSDLPTADQQRLMNVVFAVESAIREVVQPDKVNLASLGNMVPHVHWHVIPRFADDKHFPDAIWAPEKRAGSVMAEADLRPRLLEALRRRLGPPAAG